MAKKFLDQHQVNVDNDGDLQVDVLTSDVASAITSGLKASTTPGTAVVLGASTNAKKVDVQAFWTNAGLVAVGGSGVLAAENKTEKGAILQPGQGAVFHVNNLNILYLDVVTSGDGLSYNVYT